MAQMSAGNAPAAPSVAALVVAEATRAAAAEGANAAAIATNTTDIAKAVPRWAPTTTYASGAQVVSPGNDVVSANTAHTSSAAYATDVAKWTQSSTFVPQAVAQATENVAAVVLAVAPKTAGAPLFQFHENSFANTGVGAGTYNHAVHVGFNASRHSGGPGTVNGKAAIYMGFEDNYYDNGGDARYGEEWYVGYASPDGTTVPVTVLRPFYTRIFSDTNAAQGATTFMEIGTDGTGSWQVRKTVGQSLLNITPTAVDIANDTTVHGVFTCRKTSGQEVFTLGSPTAPTFLFQTGAAGATTCWTMQASAATFLLVDPNSRGLTLTSGASILAAKADVSSSLNVQGVIISGHGTATPTIAGTGNLGTTPPAPTVVGNASNGTITFGTGAGSSGGLLATVTLPTGAYATTPTVVLTASNSLSVQAQMYVNPTSATSFQLGSAYALLASQAAGTFVYQYQVIG